MISTFTVDAPVGKGRALASVDSDGLVPSARTFGTTLTETVPGPDIVVNAV